MTHSQLRAGLGLKRNSVPGWEGGPTLMVGRVVSFVVKEFYALVSNWPPYCLL